MAEENVVMIRNLSKIYQQGEINVTALNKISFSINSSEIVAIVGESGSGKSVTALAILQLLPTPPAKYLSGQILFSETGTAAGSLDARFRGRFQGL